MKTEDVRTGIRWSKWVALSGIMTALALVGNYALVTIPNVELGTVVLFLTAYTFGPLMAFWCTLIMSIIFSSLNPWGGIVPLIWFAQALGWFYVSLAGGLMKRTQDPKRIEFAITGFVVTLIFDIATTIAYAVSFNVPLVVAFLAGFWFLALHIGSNTILFPLVVPTIRSAIQDGLASMIWETENSLMEITDGV